MILDRLVDGRLDRAAADRRNCAQRGLSRTASPGLVLIAPAPDFTAELIEPNLTETERHIACRARLFRGAVRIQPRARTSIPRALIEDGRDNRVLDGTIDHRLPGAHPAGHAATRMCPTRHALKLMEHLPADDVVMTLIRDGDHRLSREEDIAKMKQAIGNMLPSA